VEEGRGKLTGYHASRFVGSVSAAGKQTILISTDANRLPHYSAFTVLKADRILRVVMIDVSLVRLNPISSNWRGVCLKRGRDERREKNYGPSHLHSEIVGKIWEAFVPHIWASHKCFPTFPDYLLQWFYGMLLRMHAVSFVRLCLCKL